MRHIIKAVLLVSVIAISAVTEAKTVGIWEDHRSYIKPELTNILAKAGWDVMFFKNRGRDGNDLENAERLAKTDVMLFCGGWNAYFFPTQKSRLNIIRYVASGKGVLLSGFRSGYVRTANRPMFPSIGCTYNRLSSPWIGPAGDNFLSDCFGGKMIAAGGNDHLVIRVGEKGTPFCGSGDDIVGAYGDYFNGKVIVFGGHFMFSNDKSEAEQILEKLLMKSLKYLSSGKMLSEEDSAFVIRQAESEFLRREIMITWAQDERGPDRRPGYIPQTRDEITSHPEALSCQLDYLISHLPLSSTPKERGISARLKSGVKIVKDKSNKLIESIKKKISSYSPTDLVLMYESNNGQLVDRKKLKDDWSRYIRVQDIEDAKKAIAALQKEVEAIKKAKLKKEIESDLKKVPSIVAKFADADPEIRFNAVLEIGRISPEDAEVAKEVVKLISDADEKVRTQAIITLGWMRSKDAVDPLIKLLSTDDVFDKRRAIQSLGHIGDKKAVAPLMKIVQD